jgi:ferrous iron transport protein B
LERNLVLALQILEVREDVVLCVNLMDEASRRGIAVDGKALETRLGVPVVTMTARKGREAFSLTDALERTAKGGFTLRYPDAIEDYIADICAIAIEHGLTRRQARLTALRLLDSGIGFTRRLMTHYNLLEGVQEELGLIADDFLAAHFPPTEGHSSRELAGDVLSHRLANAAKSIAAFTVIRKGPAKGSDRRLDRLLTGRLTAFPAMFLLLFLVLWLTVKGANIPSS